MINEWNLKCDVKQPETVIVTVNMNMNMNVNMKMNMTVTVVIAKIINPLNLQMLRCPFRT
jgi:hypothetical protein